MVNPLLLTACDLPRLVAAVRAQSRKGAVCIRLVGRFCADDLPELHQQLDRLATWIIGRTAGDPVRVSLEHAVTADASITGAIEQQFARIREVIAARLLGRRAGPKRAGAPLVAVVAAASAMIACGGDVLVRADGSSADADAVSMSDTSSSTQISLDFGVDSATLDVPTADADATNDASEIDTWVYINSGCLG
jgi:hypothetical protein